jgi:hypothetical protein
MPIFLPVNQTWTPPTYAKLDGAILRVASETPYGLSQNPQRAAEARVETPRV